MVPTNNNFTLWSGLGGRRKSWLFVMEELTVTVFVGDSNQDHPWFIADIACPFKLYSRTHHMCPSADLSNYKYFKPQLVTLDEAGHQSSCQPLPFQNSQKQCGDTSHIPRMSGLGSFKMLCSTQVPLAGRVTHLRKIFTFTDHVS